MADSGDSKLKIFQAKALPYNEKGFIDSYMSQLAAAMGASGGTLDPSLLPGMGASGKQAASPPGNYQSPNFDEFYKKKERPTITVSPEAYNDFINSAEGQKAIDSGARITTSPDARGSGGSGGPNSPVSEQERLLQLYNGSQPAANRGGQRFSTFNDLAKALATQSAGPPSAEYIIRSPYGMQVHDFINSTHYKFR